MASTAWLTVGSASFDSNPDRWGRFGNPTWDVSNLQPAPGDTVDVYGFTGNSTGNATTEAWAYNFGASVPSGATIDGVTVRMLECYSHNFERYVRMQSAYLTLSGDNTTTGTNQADTTSFHKDPTHDVVCGGPSNTWGASLDDTDVNSSDFGVVVVFERDADPGDDGGGNTAIRIPSIELQITYTEANVNVEPGAGAVTIQGYAPTVTTDSNVNVEPGAGVVTIQGHSPTVTAGTSATVEPGAGVVTIQGYAPTIGANVNAQPGAGSVTIQGYAPTVTTGTSATAEPGAGAVSIQGYAPTVAANVNVEPGAGVVSIQGYAPTVTADSSVNAEPGAGVITIQGHAPTVITGTGATVEPGAGVVTIQGYAPTVTNGIVNVQPGAGAITIRGYAPTVTDGTSAAGGRFNQRRIFLLRKKCD